jgi:Fe-S-cluster formation regulator IscX/YfhJ
MQWIPDINPETFSFTEFMRVIKECDDKIFKEMHNIVSALEQ